MDRHLTRTHLKRHSPEGVDISRCAIPRESIVGANQPQVPCSLSGIHLAIADHIHGKSAWSPLHCSFLK
jgi:hypothetical protein